MLRRPQHCNACGLESATRDTCPNCPCKYCKRYGHAVVDCPAAPPCRQCGKRGHRTERCPKQLTVSQGVFGPRTAERSRPSPFSSQTALIPAVRTSQQPSNNLLMIKTPEHHATDWLKIECREDVPMQPPRCFPQLQPLCIELLQEISKPSSDYAKLGYADYVRCRGGVEDLADGLVKDIEGNVQALQGRPLTPKELMIVGKRQCAARSWLADENVGYCNFVTDDRNAEYLRFYVGQTKTPNDRIIRRHIPYILRGRFDSLHYFTLWIGNGQRNANFLKLWSFSSKTEQTERNVQLRLNILEELACRAFNSCHAVSLRLGVTPCYGLNIMSPLKQGFSESVAETDRHVIALEKSPDVQIQAYIRLREQRKFLESERLRQPYWSLTRYWTALQECLKDHDVYRLVKQHLDRSTEPHEDSEMPIPKTSYFGTLAARVGLVVDFPPSQALNSHEGRRNNSDAFSKLRETLARCGFTSQNILLWTFDLRGFHAEDLVRYELPSVSEGSETRRVHQQILDKSKLKMVLLCGTYAERTMTSIIEHSSKYTLQLRNVNYNLYVSTDAAGVCQQVYISCPQMPTGLEANSWQAISEVSQLLRLVKITCGLEELSPYALETTNVMRMVFSQRAREKRGEPPMTTDNIDPGIHQWLQRKGFTNDNDIRNLERTVGSLTQALLVIFRNLPRQPAEFFNPDRNLGLGKNKSKDRSEKIPEYQAAQSVVKAVVTKRQEDYQRHEDESSTKRPISVDAEYTNPAFVNSPKKPKILPEEIDEANETKREQASHRPADRAICLEDWEVESKPEEEIPSIQDDVLEELSSPTDDSAMSAVCRCWNDVIQQQSADFRQDLENMKREHEIEIEIFKEALVTGRKHQEHRHKGRIYIRWEQEHEHFRGKRYPYVGLDSRRRDITICHCTFTIPSNFDVGKGEVDVMFDILDPTQRHPHLFAKDAHDDDPGKCLALKVFIKDSNGNELIHWPEYTGQKHVDRANSCVDLLINKKTWDDLEGQPRRHIPKREK